MKAKLYCTRKRRHGGEFPEFALEYEGEVLSYFKADNISEAGSIARNILDVRFSRSVDYEWAEDRL